MSKKKQLSPKEEAAAHLEKLRKSVGKRAKYEARTHAGTGKINNVYDGGRGAWVTVQSGDTTVTVRPSQVKLF